MVTAAEAKAFERLDNKVDRAVSKMEHYAALAKEWTHAELKATPENLKSAAVPIGIGASLMWLANSDMFRNADLIKKHWWLLPVAILAVGYMLSRSKDPRNRNQAKTVLAIGGGLLVLCYQNRPEAKANTSAKPGETGAIDPYRVAQQLIPADNGFAWLQGPTGQLVRVELAPMLRQFGPLLQTTAVTAPAQDAAARLAAAAFG